MTRATYTLSFLLESGPMSLFRRKPIADLVVDEADHTRSLKRVLGAGDLIMLAIGAVIGAGIFGAIGTAAAGQVAAVAVFGNPGAKFGAPLSANGQFAGRAIDVCSGGDPICSSGRDRGAHSAYELPPYPDQAAGFVAGLL